jgi:hypothetical protein
MQLSFLGQAYETAPSVVDAIATPETATFLGRTYQRKQFTITQRQATPQAAPIERIYRGVRY